MVHLLWSFNNNNKISRRDERVSSLFSRDSDVLMQNVPTLHRCCHYRNQNNNRAERFICTVCVALFSFRFWLDAAFMYKEFCIIIWRAYRRPYHFLILKLPNITIIYYAIFCYLRTKKKSIHRHDLFLGLKTIVLINVTLSQISFKFIKGFQFSSSAIELHPFIHLNYRNCYRQ